VRISNHGCVAGAACADSWGDEGQKWVSRGKGNGIGRVCEWGLAREWGRVWRTTKERGAEGIERGETKSPR